MTFEVVKIQELDIVLSILKSIAQDLKSKNISQWTQWLNPKVSDIKWVTDKIDDQCFFFIQIKGELVGMFSLSNSDIKYWGQQNSKAKYLHSLSILPNFKGRQLGEKVIIKIKSDLTNTDYKFLRLDCIATNDALINYYQSQGFEYFDTVKINSLSFLLHQFKL